MSRILFALLPIVFSVSSAFGSDNPVFEELVQKGVTMSNGAVVKLPPPILADGLDAAGQMAALGKVADARTPAKELLRDSFYAPVVVKIRSAKPMLKPSEAEGPTVRRIDLWFVAHGDWDVLTSQDFLQSAMKSKENGPNRVVVEAGILTDRQLAARKLSVTVQPDLEERFLYATFRLFDRVEISAARFSAIKRGKESILVAGRLDPRFLDDPEFPNQWRPLLRDARGEIKPGDAHPFGHAGGYAKITRLVEPADGVFIECHLVYEEPYGWFDGANLIRRKAPVMVNEKVKVFRRKLAVPTVEKENQR